MRSIRSMISVPDTFVPWDARRPNSPGWIVDDRGCHIWIGGRSQKDKGYGVVWDGQRTRVVHRLRYEREVGPVPEGMFLDHFVCDNKACCNPLHVRPVTRRENNLRCEGAAARNASRTHCPKGHPLSGDNLIAANLRLRGERACKACDKARKSTAENRAKNAARCRARYARRKVGRAT